MKVLVLGASGKLGQRLVASCLAQGHAVTAAVRDPDRFAQMVGVETVARLRLVRCDALDPQAIETAFAGQDAAISAAGNVADGERFVDLFDRVVSAAERALGGSRRLWMFGGAAILDIPHTRRIGLDLPFVPRLYLPHLANWRRLERSTLDWAMMCPGALVVGDDKPVAEGLRVSVDELPFAVGGWTRVAPSLALALMMKSRLAQLKVSYRAVADAIAGQLEPGGAFSRRRAGIGWAVRPHRDAMAGAKA